MVETIQDIVQEIPEIAPDIAEEVVSEDVPEAVLDDIPEDIPVVIPETVAPKRKPGRPAGARNKRLQSLAPRGSSCPRWLNTRHPRVQSVRNGMLSTSLFPLMLKPKWLS